MTVSCANVSSPLYLALRLFPSGYSDPIRILAAVLDRARSCPATRREKKAKTAVNLKTEEHMAVNIEDIETLRRELEALPRHQPQSVSKQDAVALLAKQLGAAQRRGYSAEELAQMLSNKGIAINAATLRGYLQRSRSERLAATSGNPDRSVPATAERCRRVYGCEVGTAAVRGVAATSCELNCRRWPPPSRDAGEPSSVTSEKIWERAGASTLRAKYVAGSCASIFKIAPGTPTPPRSRANETGCSYELGVTPGRDESAAARGTRAVCLELLGHRCSDPGTRP